MSTGSRYMPFLRVFLSLRFLHNASLGFGIYRYLERFGTGFVCIMFVVVVYYKCGFQTVDEHDHVLVIYLYFEMFVATLDHFVRAVVWPLERAFYRIVPQKYVRS
jgi:hypothetical protein